MSGRLVDSMDIYFVLGAGFAAIYDYILAHTLFCLVPAFFIAGAMAALIPKDRLLPYLGKDSPKIVAYPLAVVSGLLLAVCSCTVLPLFAGIRKGGAGIGPAIAFLYTAPATNIMAILYTGSLIGWDIALARIAFSVVFAVAVGIAISKIFPDEEEAAGSDAFKKNAGEKQSSRRLIYLFGALLAVLLVGTRIGEEGPKYGLVLALLAVIAWIIKRYFSR
ncbi:putative permease [Candidatus Burarchaeum australiense]|nr:putative permease [Candidatus Burarchaeum australiense]